MKERLSCNRPSQAMKHGCIAMNPQANIKAWSGNMSFKSVPSDGKVMLILFWKFNGPILEHYQDCGQMVQKCMILCY